MASKNEVEASMLTAEEHLKDARDAFHEGRFHDCAYHSASAAENSGNALIIALGGRVPRTHRNSEAIEFAATRLQPSWLRSEGFRKMLESLRDLEAHVVKSRYPIKVKEGIFIPPKEYYTEDMAKNMLEKAILVVNVTKHLLASLRSY